MEYLTEEINCPLDSRKIWPHLVLAIRPKHALMFYQYILFLKRWLLISVTKGCRGRVGHCGTLSGITEKVTSIFCIRASI